MEIKMSEEDFDKKVMHLKEKITKTIFEGITSLRFLTRG